MIIELFGIIDFYFSFKGFLIGLFICVNLFINYYYLLLFYNDLVYIIKFNNLKWYFLLNIYFIIIINYFIDVFFVYNFIIFIFWIILLILRGNILKL